MTAAPGPVSVSARRRRTRAQVLAALTEHDHLSRADLARLTGLSRSAIGATVASLVDEGLATEGPGPRAMPAGPGRRATVVRLRQAEGTVIGIDFGHAHVAVAVATTGGEILAECFREVDVDARPRQALDTAAELAEAALRLAGRTMPQVAGIAAGIPGPLDVRTRVVREPTILSAWVGLDPAAELGRRLGRPVTVGNDADMGAAGERAYGAAQGIDDFLYVKASHGIGAGLVLGGQTYRGSIGIAGEIGHIQLPGAISWCRCGNQGCLETVVSIAAVRRRLSHVLAGDHTPIRSSGGAPGQASLSNTAPNAAPKADRAPNRLTGRGAELGSERGADGSSDRSTGDRSIGDRSAGDHSAGSASEHAPGHGFAGSVGGWSDLGTGGWVESGTGIRPGAGTGSGTGTGPGTGTSFELPPMSRLAEIPAAARVITDAGRTIGRVLADLVNCLNPAAIILGGELGAAGAPLVAGVRESVERYASQANANAVTVMTGQLGPRAELLGATTTAARQASHATSYSGINAGA